SGAQQQAVVVPEFQVLRRQLSAQCVGLVGGLDIADLAQAQTEIGDAVRLQRFEFGKSLEDQAAGWAVRRAQGMRSQRQQATFFAAESSSDRRWFVLTLLLDDAGELSQTLQASQRLQLHRQQLAAWLACHRWRDQLEGDLG